MGSKLANSYFRKSLLVALLVGLSACGSGQLKDERNFRRITNRAVSSGGIFSGNWKVVLKNTSDGCQMGLEGKSFNAKVAIVQQKQKITLTIEGFPKSFKGSVSGNSAEGKGNYSSDGITLRGNVTVTKSSAKKIKVTNATLNLTSAEKSCKLIFSGNGSKVV